MYPVSCCQRYFGGVYPCPQVNPGGDKPIGYLDPHLVALQNNRIHVGRIEPKAKSESIVQAEAGTFGEIDRLIFVKTQSSSLSSLFGMIVKVDNGIPHYAPIVFKTGRIPDSRSVQLVEAPVNNGVVRQLDHGNIVKSRCFGIIRMPPEIT